MNGRTLLSRLSMLTALILFTAAAPAAAKVQLDQSFGEDVPLNLSAIINDASEYIAQTFTAEKSGSLAGISIYINGGTIDPPHYDLHVALHEVSNGRPTYNVLGETSLDILRPRLTDMITFPEVISIMAGKQYAIVTSYPDAPEDRYYTGAWAGNSDNLYAGGGLFSSQETGWREWDNYDLFFKTYVDTLGVPIPPTVPTVPKSPTAPSAPTSPTTPTAPKTPKSPTGPVSPTPPNLNTLFTAFTADDNGYAPAAFLESRDVQTTTNPEPMTLLLFGGGMAGAFLRRRKRHG